MIGLENRIFRLFGPAEKEYDTYRDVNGQGISERYQRLHGQYFDEEIDPYLSAIVENTVDPRTALLKFLPVLEYQLGTPPNLGSSEAQRRKVMQMIVTLYKIKGTARCYEAVFRLLGFDTTVITEYYPESKFDMPPPFDTIGRKFDQKCRTCSQYSLALTGTVIITPELEALVFAAVEFCEPINADLLGITYNGNPVGGGGAVALNVSQDGYLVLDNDNDPTTTATIDADGNVVLDGPNAGQYAPGTDGDVVYNY